MFIIEQEILRKLLLTSLPTFLKRILKNVSIFFSFYLYYVPEPNDITDGSSDVKSEHGQGRACFILLSYLIHLL